MTDDPTFIPESFWMGVMGEEGRQDPYPLFATIDGPACSYAAAQQALRDPRFAVLGVPDSDRLLWQTFNRWLISLNPPEHTQLRQRISRAFTKGAVTAYQPHVEATVTRLVDSLVPRGRADLVADFALPLPTSVIADLMDLPPATRAGLDTLLLDLGLAFANRDDPTSFDRGEAALVVLFDRLRPVLEQRIADPGDDLLSRLCRSEGGDDDVAFDDLLANAVFLLQAGQESTQNTIASAVYALLSDPEQLALVRADRDLVPWAVEETLRVHSAIQVAPRLATTDLELDRWSLPAGAVIPFFLGAVNRDPTVFLPDPDRFDVSRRTKAHLAFAFGAHLCLGAPLARLEIQIALGQLLTRLPDLHLVETPRWIGTIPFRGLAALEVAWTA